MFGTLRYCLAWMVVVKHLWLWNWVGLYAVFGFYLLSGYLMTLVLTRVYPYSPRGLVRFFTNRALRIYPPYYLAAGLGLAAVLLQPDLARTLNPSLQLPGAAGSWLRNLVIFGQDVLRPPRLVPPAWSLHVELIFYVLMGLGLSRRRWIATLWFGASLGYTAYLLAHGAPFGLRYYPALAASLPFSTGAVLYHYRNAFRMLARPSVLAVLGIAFLVNASLPGLLWKRVFVEGFYASLILTGLLVGGLCHFRAREMPDWLARIDRRLGDLSYPIFLCHWAVAVFAAWIGFGGQVGYSGRLFWSSIVGVHLVAWGVHAGVERPLEALRTRLRQTSSEPGRKG